MRHRRFFLGLALLASGTLPFLGLGCGSLLGLEEPTDRPTADAATVDAVDAAACAVTDKMCSGVCVPTDDPQYGCGGECSACPSPANAKPGCVSSRCGLGACHAGFGDCDMNPVNGCETELTTKSACGMCGLDCANQVPPRKYCVPGGGGTFSCSDTCTSPSIVCPGDGECVDPMKDPKHCGATCADCTVANGTGTCDAGVCNIKCNAYFCQVGNTCVGSDNQHCYPAPTSCSACNGNEVCVNAPGPGCVPATCTQDDAHCGVNCATNCTVTLETCVSGVCVAPDAGPPNDGSLPDGMPPIDAACFVAGTPITLANGTTKPIEQIEIGDEVLSYDTVTRTRVPGQVVKVFVHPHTTRLARLNGIVTTPEHRFYANGAWIPASQLSIGDTLVSAEQDLAETPGVSGQTANELQMISGDTTTYNFEVAVFHDYFAGHYLVHNVKTADL